ncbi:MAG: NRAMP family divalent metal transporter [Pseudomonadota bacterium]
MNPPHPSERPVATRIQSLGPGLIMAAAAVGASHLVASTQAGALFGWQLLWLVLLVNVLKYPFFRFGVQYTMTHGASLMEGYLRKGRPWLIAFTAMNLLAAVVNTAAVLLLTANLLAFFMPGDLSVTLLCVLLLAISLGILLGGHYRLLDSVSKVIMFTLSVATVIAVIIAVGNGSQVAPDFDGPSPWQLSMLAFLVAMIGWMPVPIELSAINSMWLRSKQRLLKISPSQALFDFNLGYGMAVILALVFLSLGALIQYGTEQEIAMAGAAFTQQLVSMYSATIGEWSELLVAFIAFMCMFGTTLAVMDGYARTLEESFHLLRNEEARSVQWRRRRLSLWIIGQAVAGMVIILFFQSALNPMLTFAMTLAFVTTPFFAWLNFSLVREDGGSVSRGMKVLAWAGLIYLGAFSLFYIVWWLGTGGG